MYEKSVQLTGTLCGLKGHISALNSDICLPANVKKLFAPIIADCIVVIVLE